jgi:8-oxo-dGTP diphosphatase
MRRTENTIFTNMCMVYDGEGNVLVQNRLNPDWPGIVFPGGHVEAGESFYDAAVREVFEETGLTVSELQMCGIKDWFRDDGTRYVVLLYKTDKFEGELTSSDEGEVMWIPLAKMQGMEITESMKTMLKVFLEDNLSEQFFYKEDGKWIEVLK